MEPRCCPTCRVLAHEGTHQCTHCGDETVVTSHLARPAVTGVTAITRAPAKGWRDTVALLLTSFGIFASAGVGALYLGPAGLLAGPLFGIVGYTKQFWRTALARRDRVRPIIPRLPPPGDRLAGVAQPHERTLDVATSRPQPLVVASFIGLDNGVIARRIEAVPFWLVLADNRRILVDGVVDLRSQNPERLDAASTRKELDAAGIPLTRAERKRITLSRVCICAGDKLSALGAITPEQLVGAGYRDHLVEAMRGQPGHPLWLEIA